MDTWFTTEPMIQAVLDTGLDTIGMVKQLKQRYSFQGISYTLPELRKFVDFSGAGNIFGSLVVRTKTGIPVKIVFVRNRNNKSECLYILSTDISLESARSYGFMAIVGELCRYRHNSPYADILEMPIFAFLKYWIYRTL